MALGKKYLVSCADTVTWISDNSRTASHRF